MPRRSTRSDGAVAERWIGGEQVNTAVQRAAEGPGGGSSSQDWTRVETPLAEEAVNSLRCGQRVRIHGWVYAARDAAHQRLFQLLQEGRQLPIDLRGAVIFYVGPSPAPPGRLLGAAGPTTAGRVDRFTPALLRAGLRGMIGKGYRSEAVKQAMQEYGAVYFAAVGGAGVLLAQHIAAAEVVAYPELGPEAIRRLRLVNFPAIVAVDRYGGDLYQIGKSTYRRDGAGEPYRHDGPERPGPGEGALSGQADTSE
ncbi:MAG: fumarate hydratase C-terminal domain-containing protein [Limnochordaceae bacterium]|nr:fumarate hydratase C-terminal domain-containing protein [Limnochordaceae bacterium]